MKIIPFANARIVAAHRVSVTLIVLIAGLAFDQALAINHNGPNGSTPRPFYVFAHNPNTHAEVTNSLAAGANALEPDIEVMNSTFYTAPQGSLIVYHDSVLSYTRDPEPLNDYLEFLHSQALVYPQLSLVAFDIKSAAATAAYGSQILSAVRTHLNYGPVYVNVIFSVGDRSDSAVFNNIIDILGPREGIQIDAEDDPQSVVTYLGHLSGVNSRGWQNPCYGNGTLGPGPNLHKSISSAAGLRAAYGFPKAIPYVFTIQDTNEMRLFIDNGTDGMIPDISNVLNPTATDQPTYCAILRNIVVNERADVRMATREDNPFRPANDAYAVIVDTGTDSGAGTNAEYRITLFGSNGTSSVEVDTSYAGMMENGEKDYVTIPSRDLGPLSKVRIRRLNVDPGGAPWQVVNITVRSAGWLSPAATQNDYYWAGDFVVSGYQTDYDFGLTHRGQVPYANAWASPRSSDFPALDNPSSFAPDGEIGRPWQEFLSAYDYIRSGGTIHLGAGSYYTPAISGNPATPLGRLDKPCRITKESAAPYSSGNVRLTKPSNP